MRSLLVDEYPLIVLPSLAKEIGLNEAIMLQQIHFWIGKKNNYKDGRYWVYNTYDEWLEQFPFWSLSTLKRTITSLSNKKLIIIGNFNKAKFDKTNWYTINYDALNSVNQPLGQNEPIDSSNWTIGMGQNEQTNTIDYPETNNIESSSKGNPFHFYETNFGVLSPFISESIKQWCSDLSDELVIESMKIALKEGKRFNYAEGILKKWYSNNIKTLNDVKAAENEFKNKRKPKKKNDIDWDNL